MAKGYILSEEDAVTLKRLLNEYRRRDMRLEQTIRDDHELSTDDFLPPEVYVARLPSIGIEPLIRAIDPDGVIHYVPGHTRCDIYRFKPRLGDYELLPAEFDVNVYNVSTAWVDGLFKIVWRDKFGFWVTECPCLETTGTGTTGTGSLPPTGTGTGTASTGTGTTPTGTGTSSGTGSETGTGTSTGTEPTGTGTETPPTGTGTETPPTGTGTENPPTGTGTVTCEYTGSVTVGTGSLYRVGDNVYESRVTLTFENGRLCGVASATPGTVDVCDCEDDTGTGTSSGTGSSTGTSSATGSTGTGSATGSTGTGTSTGTATGGTSCLTDELSCHLYTSQSECSMAGALELTSGTLTKQSEGYWTGTVGNYSVEFEENTSLECNDRYTLTIDGIPHDTECILACNECPAGGIAALTTSNAEWDSGSETYPYLIAQIGNGYS